MDQKGLTAVLVIKRSVDAQPKVNMGNLFTQAAKFVSEGSILALKPKTDVMRSSKQGYPAKGVMSSNYPFLKTQIYDFYWPTEKWII